MLRMALVEDDDGYAAQLKQFIARFSEETGQEISMTWFPDGMDIAEDYKPVNDIIFMDIEMPLLNGMETAERIRQNDQTVIIIFITNMAQYAIKGYEVNALDYVLKPINYYAFSMKLRKACRIASERNERAVILTVDGEQRKIPVRLVRYVEVSDHRLIYHLEKEDISVFKSLKDAETELGAGFSRCNNCYLVNLRFVDGIKDDCAVLGKDLLKISRTRKKAFMQELSDYFKNGGR